MSWWPVWQKQGYLSCSRGGGDEVQIGRDRASSVQFSEQALMPRLEHKNNFLNDFKANRIFSTTSLKRIASHQEANMKASATAKANALSRAMAAVAEFPMANTPSSTMASPSWRSISTS